MPTHETRPTPTTNRHAAAHGFTVVELLVVMSIIVLLMTVMMPAVGKARENARRVLCGSNERQVLHVAISYASDFSRYLPYGGTNNNNTEHIHWINDRVFREYEQRVGAKRWDLKSASYYPSAKQHPSRVMDIFYCPNQDYWEWHWKANKTKGTTSFGHRLGYYLIYGHGQANKPLPWTGETNPWFSPRKVSDPSDSVMVTDIVERGTDVPNITSITHAAYGDQLTQAGVFVDPLELGSEGVMSGYLDGAVHWRQQSELRERSAHTTGKKRGWW